MRISEVITILQKIQKEQGDLDCFIELEYSTKPVDKVYADTVYSFRNKKLEEIKGVVWK